MVLFDVWGQRGWPGTDIVGESHHTKEIRALLPKRLPDEGAELFMTVMLRHDAANRYDPNAVEISGSTGALGHLPRESAALYAPVLSALAQNGFVATTAARIWGGNRLDWETEKTQFVGSVRIDLPEPHMLVPTNLPPSSAHVVLPTGSTIQVTGEENYGPALEPYLCPAGECWVYATLSDIVVEGPRSSKTVVEVRIDGNVIGTLTPAMSTAMVPVIAYLADRGQATAVRAIVKGNRLRADVVLHTAKAADLPDTWFNGFSEANSTTTLDPDVGFASATVDPATGIAVVAPPLPPADWYADPHHVARLRYWDGTAWTEHTAP